MTRKPVLRERARLVSYLERDEKEELEAWADTYELSTSEATRIAVQRVVRTTPKDAEVRRLRIPPRR